MTDGVSIKVDASSLTRVSNLLHSAGKKPLGMIRAVNHTGDKARTQMRRVLVDQTGLKMKTIRKAVTSKRAFNGGAYEIKSRGGDVRLMFFGARETQKGVSAAPWNKRQIYPGSFMKGGLFPNRKGMVAGVAVVRRVGNENSGCSVGGVTYPSDRETQAKLTAAALFAQVDNTQIFQWKLADGSFSEPLSAAEMIAVAAAVGGYVKACFVEEAEVVAEIDAGTITTREEIVGAFT